MRKYEYLSLKRCISQTHTDIKYRCVNLNNFQIFFLHKLIALLQKAFT